MITMKIINAWYSQGGWSYLTPNHDLVLLEMKGVAQQESVNFPPFIRVIEDVTGNPQYYNYNIALRR